MKKDERHKIIGGRHRALSRWYMICNRLKNTHLKKNKAYTNIKLNMDKEEFILWFMLNDFEGCSVDRIDNTKDYELTNLQLIPLSENIRKDKIKAINGKCVCYKCEKEKKLEEFVKDKKRKNGRSTICKECDRIRGIEKYKRLYKHK